MSNINMNSRLALNPTTLDIPRSTWNRPHSVKTSFNVGEIIPLHCYETLPGMTSKMKLNMVVRLQTPITPFMDNLVLDVSAFASPMRLNWNHTKNFFGENTTSAWVSEAEYSIPQVEAPAGGWETGTIADYLGIPIKVDGFSVNALPFRAYAGIVNEWYRDQNLQDPLLIPTDDATGYGVNTGDQITDCALGGKPFIACKFHDLFTSALPSPQKGDPVSIGLNTTGPMPVVPLNQTWDPNDIFNIIGEDPATSYNIYGGVPDSLLGNVGGQLGVAYATGMQNVSGSSGMFNNLFAISSSNANATTINELRLAFQTQKFLERAARGGTRYREVIKAHFGVTSPDARMQVPEFLGGKRIPINVNQVIQQSATGSGDTPLGNVAAMSLTVDSDELFTKSFTEHGYVMILAVVRYDHTYQQGLNKMFSRKTMWDFFWPEFSTLGEQPVKNREIFLQGRNNPDGDVDDEVFGYQEAWYDYRYIPNKCTGEMRSTADQSLDVWHLGDDYSELPRLSAEWIREDKTNVDRVLAVSSSVSNQLFCDCYFNEQVTMPMPMYSIPGLIDHF